MGFGGGKSKSSGSANPVLFEFPGLFDNNPKRRGVGSDFTPFLAKTLGVRPDPNAGTLGGTGTGGTNNQSIPGQTGPNTSSGQSPGVFLGSPVLKSVVDKFTDPKLKSLSPVQLQEKIASNPAVVSILKGIETRPLNDLEIANESSFSTPTATDVALIQSLISSDSAPAIGGPKPKTLEQAVAMLDNSASPRQGGMKNSGAGVSSPGVPQGGPKGNRRGPGLNFPPPPGFG